MSGWVKMHRALTDSFAFQNPDRLKFWVWCLCKASHKSRIQNVGLQEVHLEKGQFVFGRKKASAELNMSESKIYRLTKTFEKREQIEVKSNNKFSVITVVNWELYQDSEQQSEQHSNNKLTTNEQQSNTNKNVKKEKNVKNDINTSSDKPKINVFIPPTVDEVLQYCSERSNNVNAETFVDFYESKGWLVGKNKMKSWKAAVRTWEKNNSTVNSTSNDKKPNNKNAFHNFGQRTTNYTNDQLEQKLLNKRKG